VDGAQGDVREIADGRRDEVKRGGRILLAAGCGRSGLAKQ